MGKEKAPPIGRLQNSRIPSVGTAILQLAIVVFYNSGEEHAPEPLPAVACRGNICYLHISITFVS